MMGFSFKKVTKPVTKAVKSVTKAVGNVLEAPFDVASGVMEGDVNKVLNGTTKAATGGIISHDKSGGGLFNVTDTVGTLVGGLAGANAVADALNAQSEQEKTAQEALAKQQEDAKAAAIARRRADLSGDTQTIHTSALGDVGGSAVGKTKKKTVLGG